MQTRVRKITDEERKNATGRCYICAFRYMAKIPDSEIHLYRLVHGEMIKWDEKGNGVQFGHAWVEKEGEFVIDLRHDLRRTPHILSKEDYYQQFDVIEKTLRKYTIVEMYEVGLKAGAHYGPWASS
jgi:hypothetical protein